MELMGRRLVAAPLPCLFQRSVFRGTVSQVLSSVLLVRDK